MVVLPVDASGGPEKPHLRILRLHVIAPGTPLPACAFPAAAAVIARRDAAVEKYSAAASSGILGFGYVRGYDSGFGPLHGDQPHQATRFA